MSRNKIGSRTRQKHHSTHHIFGLAHAPQRNTREQILAQLGIIKRRLCQRRQNKRRPHGINRNLIGRPLHSQYTRQIHHTGLTRTISRAFIITHHPILRRDIHNLATTRLNHRPRHTLRHKKQPLQIHIQHLIPIRLCHLERIPGNIHTRIIHQYINPTISIDNPAHRRLNTLQIWQLQCQRQCPLIQTFNRFTHLLQRTHLLRHLTHRHIGTHLSHRNRNRPSNARTRSRHQHNLIIQSHTGQNHYKLLKGGKR